MKKVYLVGFRGVGFKNRAFEDEDALIWAGHVGFCFEDEEYLIYGFHPTPEASEQIGDSKAVVAWLKRHNPIAGRLFDDTPIFLRAYELSLLGVDTTVWELVVELEDHEFEAIRALTKEWYNNHTEFLYAFPSLDNDDEESITDNCATFPRRVGIPIPEETGNLRDYIPLLQENGKRWRPFNATNNRN